MRTPPPAEPFGEGAPPAEARSAEVSVMTSLETLVEPLKRELAIPGVFADVFPSTSDDDLQAALADGFAEAQLWGFFPTVTVAENNGVFETSKDLSAAAGALILAFTATRILRSQLRSLNSMERYKAGPVEYETQRAASALKAELDYLTSYLNKLIEQGQRASNTASLATVFDNYQARATLQVARGSGFYNYELVGTPSGSWV